MDPGGHRAPPANSSRSQSDDDSTVSVMMPTGLAAAILTLAIFFSVASLVVVSMRIWVRARAKILGLDDGLMAVGLILFLANAGLASYATFHGLGIPVAEVERSISTVGLKYVTIWQPFYIVSLVFIKNSICITLLRIAIEKYHRWMLYATLTVSTLVSLVGLVGVLSVCRPIQAQWDLGSGDCAPRSVVISLNYLISAGAIVTDWSCAIVPSLIIWNAQMRTRVKWSVSIVLALGSLASLSTLARLPYLQYYGDSNNFLYAVGYIVLWSIIEGGFGLVAGSLPMLRQLFQRWIGSIDEPMSMRLPQVATIGSSRRRPNNISILRQPIGSPNNLNTLEQGGEWERLDDASTHSKHPHDPHNDHDIVLDGIGRLRGIQQP